MEIYHKQPRWATKIGLNVADFQVRYQTWKQTATDEQAESAHNIGMDRWAAAAAKNDGILTITLNRDSCEDRTYTIGHFPIQSMDKALRESFTAAEPGHVLIDLDWKSCHWQLIAFRSGDEALQQVIINEDLYTSIFNGTERSKAKAAWNAKINGAGKAKLAEILGGEEIAADFIAKEETVLTKTCKKAGDWLAAQKKLAVTNGHSESYAKAAGIALMRLEAEALWTAMEWTKDLCEKQGLSCAFVIPMHDGVLLSAPAAQAEQVAKTAQACMAVASTGCDAQTVLAVTDKLVSCKISSSWGGSVAQLTRQDMRTLGFNGLRTYNQHNLTLSAAYYPEELKAERKKHHGRKPEAVALQAAMDAVTAMNVWAKRVNNKLSGTPTVDVECKDQYGAYLDFLEILRKDKAFPKLRHCVRGAFIEKNGIEHKVDAENRLEFGPLLDERYGYHKFNQEDLFKAVEDVAYENQFDPVKDWMEALPMWDGVKRLDYWLENFAHADGPPALLRAYSRKFLIAMVARAYQPGCKADNVLVLLGNGGIGKTRLLQALAPAGSYGNPKIDPENKDTVINASKFALVEWEEMTGHSRREDASLKAFFSTCEDTFRWPYSKKSSTLPRQFMVAATTNNDDFLRDPTGSRRFWAVNLSSEIDVAGLKAAHAQLWAEAVNAYKHPGAEPGPQAGFAEREAYECRWWLTTAEDDLRLGIEAEFTPESAFFTQIENYVDGKDYIRMEDMCRAIGIESFNFSRYQKEFALVLRSLDFERRVCVVEHPITKARTKAKLWVRKVQPS